MVAQSDELFLSEGGLPARILQPHPPAAEHVQRTIEDAGTVVARLKAERDQLQSLCVIAEHFAAIHDRATLIATILSDLLRLLAAERSAVFLSDSNGNLHAEGIHQRDGAGKVDGEHVLMRGLAEQVWSRRQPVLIEDLRQELLWYQQPGVQRLEISSVICVPLLAHEQVLGALYVERTHAMRAYAEAQLDLMAAFSNQCALAVANVTLFAGQHLQMQEIAAMKTYTDSILTSIGNGVLAIDTNGRITRVNAGFERIFGERAANLLGFPLALAFANIDAGADLATEIDASTRSSDVHQKMITTSALGQIAPLQLSITWSPLHDAENQRIGTVIVVDDLTGLAEERDTARRIERYVHPNVIQLVTQHPSQAFLGGRTREVSVIFADIRGFTSLSEGLTPDKLFSVLNAYLDLLTQIVFDEGGTVTMFQGDALMAIFNAPIENPNHPLQATRAAWRMSQAIEEYNVRNGHTRTLQFGIGVNLGPALIGNIGHARIQNYTAIGDTINSAKRLEEFASGNRVLLSDALYQRVKSQVTATKVNDVIAKGKSQPITTWELHGLVE